jgi:hypothetical protein
MFLHEKWDRVFDPRSTARTVFLGGGPGIDSMKVDPVVDQRDQTITLVHNDPLTLANMAYNATRLPSLTADGLRYRFLTPEECFGKAGRQTSYDRVLYLDFDAAGDAIREALLAVDGLISPGGLFIFSTRYSLLKDLPEPWTLKGWSNIRLQIDNYQAIALGRDSQDFGGAAPDPIPDAAERDGPPSPPLINDVVRRLMTGPKVSSLSSSRLQRVAA